MPYPSSSAVVTAIFSDSACFLDVGLLLKEAFIGNAVTEMLGVQQLSQPELLLALDDCEYLRFVCAMPAGTCVQVCSRLHILAISHVTIERRSRVSSPALAWAKADARLR